MLGVYPLHLAEFPDQGAELDGGRALGAGGHLGAGQVSLLTLSRTHTAVTHMMSHVSPSDHEAPHLSLLLWLLCGGEAKLRRLVLSLAHLTQAVVEVVLSRMGEPQVRHRCSVTAISAPRPACTSPDSRPEPEEPPSVKIDYKIVFINIGLLTPGSLSLALAGCPQPEALELLQAGHQPGLLGDGGGSPALGVGPRPVPPLVHQQEVDGGVVVVSVLDDRLKGKCIKSLALAFY